MAKIIKVIELRINGKTSSFHNYVRSYASFLKTFTQVYKHWGKVEAVERPDLVGQDSGDLCRALIAKATKKEGIL